MAVSLNIQFGRVDLEIKESPVTNSHFHLKMTERGEHQDDPRHRFHKPDNIIETSIRREQITELIDDLRRLL